MQAGQKGHHDGEDEEAVHQAKSCSEPPRGITARLEKQPIGNSAKVTL
jgi:hypothetical protein